MPAKVVARKNQRIFFFDDNKKPNENENDNNNINDNVNVNDKMNEKDFSKEVLSDEERAALIKMSDELTVENYITNLRNWQISNRKVSPKHYVVIKLFIEEDAVSPKKNTNFTAASNEQSFDIERIERYVKTFTERNADQLGDETPDTADQIDNENSNSAE